MRTLHQLSHPIDVALISLKKSEIFFFYESESKTTWNHILASTETRQCKLITESWTRIKCTLIFTIIDSRPRTNTHTNLCLPSCTLRSCASRTRIRRLRLSVDSPRRCAVRIHRTWCTVRPPRVVGSTRSGCDRLKRRRTKLAADQTIHTTQG